MTIATVAQPVSTEPDSTSLSKRLQDKGISLARVAVHMLGYKALSGYDSFTHDTSGETYLVSKYGNGAISVTTDKNGVDIAHIPFGLSHERSHLQGQFSFNTIDFLLAHDSKLAGPREAAEAICMAAFLCSQADAAALIAPVVPRELDLNYAHSLSLQKRGVSLTDIAETMFGFNVVHSNANEAYIFNGPVQDQDSFVAVVYPNSDGLQIAHYNDPVDGRPQVCAVRFAMQHANIKAPLDAISAINRQVKSRPAVA